MSSNNQFPLDSSLDRREAQPFRWRALSHLLVLSLLVATLFALRLSHVAAQEQAEVTGQLLKQRQWLSGEPLQPAPEGLAEPSFPVVSGNSLDDDMGDWTRIAFTSFRDGNGEIYFMRGDGEMPTRVTAHPASDLYPRLNRGGTRLVFVSDRDGETTDLYAVNVDGSHLQKLTHHGAHDSMPAWSPDGTRLAFASNREGNWEIFLINADGSGERRLTVDPALDTRPTWSPDGQQIAWVRIVSDSEGVVMAMNADGSGLRALTGPLRFLSGVAWSPDGRRLALTYDANGDFWGDIARFDLSDGRMISVGLAPRFTDLLIGSWAPYGDTIVYTRLDYVVHNNELYISGASIYRTGQYQPLPGSGLDLLPDWQPTDITPPSSEVLPLPPLVHRDDYLILQFAAEDTGGAGLDAFELQARDGESGEWKNVYLETWDIENRKVRFYPEWGRPQYFRIRASDRAGNWEAWPATPDTFTTVYGDRAIGIVSDAREVPLPGAVVNGEPEPFQGKQAGKNGFFDALFATGRLADIQIWMTREGYRPSSKKKVIAPRMLSFYLSSPDEVLVNGAFDEELGGWEVGGTRPASTTCPSPSMPTIQLGGDIADSPWTSSLSQRVTIPATMHRPTLSLIYYHVNGDVELEEDVARFEILVDEEVIWSTTEETEWRHLWIDLEPWQGRTIDLTFFYADDTGNSSWERICLDDISLASWRTPLIEASTPAHFARSWSGKVITLTGDNFDPEATVRIGEKAATVEWVDETELRVIVPAGLSLGLHDIWVTNPDGYESVLPGGLQLGTLLHLPTVTR